MARAFDSVSELRLIKCDGRLAGVLREAIKRTPFGWRIVQSDRSVEQQRVYFQAGKSKINPDDYDTLADLYKKAKHITGPGMPLSRAVDVAIVDGKPYDLNLLKELNATIQEIAKSRGLSIRWGGDFDKDGKPYEPGTFVDAPHFEIL